MFRQVLSGTVTWSSCDYIVTDSANPDMMAVCLKLTVWNWSITRYITLSNPSGHQVWVNALWKLGVWKLVLTPSQRAKTAWQRVARRPPLCTTVPLLRGANIHTMNEEGGVHPALNMSILWIKRRRSSVSQCIKAADSLKLCQDRRQHLSQLIHSWVLVPAYRHTQD